VGSGRCTLPGYGHVTPYQQGELSGLCGVYSAINAARLLSPELATQRALWIDLYRYAVQWLGEQGRLRSGLVHGLSYDLWKELQHAIHDELSCKRGISYRMRPLIRRRTRVPGSDPAAHVRQALQEGRPVLCALAGELDHYTVIAGHTHSRWLLHDSYGYRWVAKRTTAFEHAQGERHCIPLSTLMVLYRSENQS